MHICSLPYPLPEDFLLRVLVELSRFSADSHPLIPWVAHTSSTSLLPLEVFAKLLSFSCICGRLGGLAHLGTKICPVKHLKGSQGSYGYRPCCREQASGFQSCREALCGMMIRLHSFHCTTLTRAAPARPLRHRWEGVVGADIDRE